MIIAGVDPGLAATGYGVIEQIGNRITPLEWGVIRSGEGTLADRLQKIHNRLVDVFENHNPDLIGVEDIFIGQNPRSALMLGHARGVILLAAASRECRVYEYPARSVKQSVVGNGGARKEQVRFMVSRLLGTGEKKIAMDASDALAVAICCSMRNGTNKV
ncbi:MAG: crossover junction endodeoxyribonuclease RuvC [Calditrichaeota bacterium]|nr:crossover junction endodeoxyribonuclease RuvC [Calditrichota bacterium]MBT7618866.1 crossover junction endodeoxyribonuclease RuvC [Calditrichota bacterium]MBT7787863.1 crossover junction endodeoxyribonuclease RuvC [Calditrichota bacterium]